MSCRISESLPFSQHPVKKCKIAQVERRRMPSSVFRTKANDEGENRDFHKHLRRFFPSNVKSRKSFAKVFSFEHFKLEILRRF